MAVPGLDPGISPGHPDWKSDAPQAIEITGTRPVMTWRTDKRALTPCLRNRLALLRKRHAARIGLRGDQEGRGGDEPERIAEFESVLHPLRRALGIGGLLQALAVAA